MADHSSATARTQTPHVNRTTRTNSIINALKQRAQSVLNDETLDPQSRAILRYALEMNDAESERDEADSSREKIEALAEIICRSGDETAAALLVLMGMLQNSAEPKTLAHTVEHFAFTRCGELNVHDMVDVQVAMLENELFAGK